MKNKYSIIISDRPLIIEEVKFSEEKTAILTLVLKAESGYLSEESYKISPQQWYEIIKILQKKKTKEL